MLTFVIPVADYHAAIVERAIASVHAQTLPCACIVVHDHDHQGAGAARNVGLSQVDTPFVVFLDSDDWVEPDFAEKCLLAYDARHYIYMDWQLEDGGLVRAPSCAWDADGSWHVLTALLPTAAVRAIGGFDERMRGGEDTDLYWHLTRSGLCGKRLPEPLFHYGKQGRRGKAHVDSPEHEAWRFEILRRYGDKPMACCVDEVITAQFNPGDAQPGDVLASLLREGGRTFVGSATGRFYRKFGNAHQLWMNPADIDANPMEFARVVELPPAVSEQSIADFKALARRAMGTKSEVYVTDENAPVTTVNMPRKADVDGVLRLYNSEMTLTKQEVKAVRHGAKLEVSEDGVKINRPHAPDSISRKTQDGNAQT